MQPTTWTILQPHRFQLACGPLLSFLNWTTGSSCILREKGPSVAIVIAWLMIRKRRSNSIVVVPPKDGAAKEEPSAGKEEPPNSPLPAGAGASVRASVHKVDSAKESHWSDIVLLPQSYCPSVTNSRSSVEFLMIFFWVLCDFCGFLSFIFYMKSC